MTLRRKALFFVLLPTLVACIYYLFIATDMYVSESSFSVRSPDSGGTSEWLSLLGQYSVSTTSDAYILENYILSPDLLFELEGKLKLKEHYQNPQADFISRLNNEPSAEEFLDYYRDVIKLSFDASKGIFQLSVRAFSPIVAQSISREIIARSEELINDLRDRAMDDLLSLSRKEVKVAENRLAVARQNIKRFRQDNNLLDPEATAGAVLGLVAELEGQAAKARAELAEMRSYMQESSANIVALRARIDAVEQQVKVEKARLTGQDSKVINEIVAKFEELSMEHEFAEKQYVSALTSLETARIRAESQGRYLIDFISPTLPEESMWPRRGISILLSFACAVMFFAIGSLFIAAVREHAGA